MSMMDDIYSTLFPSPVIPPSDTPNIDHPVGTESTHEQSLTNPTPGVHEGYLSPEQHDAIRQALTMALGIGDGGGGRPKPPFANPEATHLLHLIDPPHFPSRSGPDNDVAFKGYKPIPMVEQFSKLDPEEPQPAQGFTVDTRGFPSQPLYYMRPAADYAGGWADPIQIGPDATVVNKRQITAIPRKPSP